MKKISENDVPYEQVTKAGSVNTKVQWLITSETGAPNFAMRRYVMDKGGQVGLHSHNEEHEVYILKGKADFSNGEETIHVKSGDTMFIPSNEQHMITNTGNESFEFICIIPGAEKR